MSSWNLPEPIGAKPAPGIRERVSRGVRAPIAVGIVLFLAAVVGAVAIVALRPHAPETTAVAAAPVEGPPGSPVLPGTGGESADERRVLLVHVVGEVHDPGVVELDEGARVREAIAAAGGATESAVLEGVNLARPVADGEQIVVPNAGTLDAVRGDADLGAAGAPGAPIDLNRADSDALQTLPRIGPALAQRIVSWREANGPFTSVEQLLEVPGIGFATFESLRELVRV